MKAYTELIESAPIVRDVDAVVTTGDVDYPGTALEVWDGETRELFHVVADSAGELQVLFLSANYRISLAELEEILAKAKDLVRLVPDDPTT